ncbi:hypothetical protein [Nonomuraea guangzhouensis]|uniref:Uncharacterized protein n=1 Tax=Nonomuraea guangzhouensis TaxID=1291555 RepID=A0ABW4GV07_9ACTN|nr:hypothetical protein [Nonomuraea guangzhouensis]
MRGRTRVAAMIGAVLFAVVTVCGAAAVAQAADGGPDTPMVTETHKTQ